MWLMFIYYSVGYAETSRGSIRISTLNPTSHTKIEPIHGVIVFLQFILRNNQEKTVPSYIFSGATTPIKFRAF